MTDRGNAYASLAGLLTARTEDWDEDYAESQSTFDRIMEEGIHADTSTVLVPLALEIVDSNQFSLEQLIEFRKAETAQMEAVLKISVTDFKNGSRIKPQL